MVQALARFRVLDYKTQREVVARIKHIAVKGWGRENKGLVKGPFIFYELGKGC